MIIIVVILYVKIQRTNLSIYSPVKSIQSNLKHLSWVAQRVAAGDYKQHVSSLGSFSDSFNEMIDQLSHYREKMEHISNTDVLTGIANRRAFNQMIKKLWDKDIPCAIVFIDIDGLKYVNDNYGHSGGNRYIKEVCQILKMNLKEDEFIFRIGGDELLILSKKEDAHICEERLLEIRLQFREEMKKKVPYPCDFSFGCVDIDKKENKTISEYLSLADKKMYHFKMIHYIDQRRPKYSNHIDKSGLDSRIFDAFSQTSINCYAYICNMETNVSRWFKLSKTLNYLMNICMMQVKYVKNIFIQMIVKNMKKILKQFSLERKNVMI